jgi:seryl-tRNA synthetase
MQQNPNLFSGLGPFAGLAQAGSQLATRGIQGLFGIKDPVLERNRILSQVNYDDPTSIRAAAQALMAQGDVDAGMQLAGQARQIQQQERSFGLQEKQLTAAEQRAKAEQEYRNKRLELSGKELDLKLDELKLREDVSKAQIEKISAEIKALEKGDYSIREQKGPGQETVSFVAINNKPPFDQKIIPVSAGALAPTGTTPVQEEESKKTTRRGDRKPLGSFAGESR